MSRDLVFRSSRVVTPHGESAACVVVQDGTIVALEPYDHATVGNTTVGAVCIDVGDAALLPGLVDTHVHLNEPGRAEWEGFTSGTRAAAAGGITTLVDMPLNSVPATTTVAALEVKRAAASGRCHVDVGFWGGVVPGNDADIAALWDAGVLGFKCFLAPSGVGEFGAVDAADLVRVLPLLGERGAALLVHAELPALLQPAAPGADARSYAGYLATRPDAAEVEAVRLLVELCRETRARIHVVHVASAQVLPLLRGARAETLPFTAETCPHYLHFDAETIGDGRTAWKCAPPIRSAANREVLWQALVDGDLDLVASAHSPASPELKLAGDGSFLDAWGGIASLQLSLPVVWNGARDRGIPLSAVAGWMAAAPARLAGLPMKGAIEVGRDADFVVFDADAQWTVAAESLYHRHPLTPYDGELLAGVVRATYLRGELIYDADGGHGVPRGRTLERSVQGAEWTSST
jgi:allantoinase